MDFSEFKQMLNNKKKDIPSSNVTNTNTIKNKTNQIQSHRENSKKNITVKKGKGKTENVIDFQNFIKKK